ncbi:hypothetical protein JCM16303_001502 [Sporobolomyces ruberrimus]
MSSKSESNKLSQEIQARASSTRELDSLEKASSKPSTTRVGGKRSLRVAIVTENFLPKVDGVTRTLAMLLEHLAAEGHEAMVFGPSSPLKSYAGHEVVSTKGIPLLGVYKGLGLNFARPLFVTKLKEFKPDVVQFVDPIWLCAQMIPIVSFYLPNTPLVSSYHTNLAMYATLFGFRWITPTMWGLQRALHGRCDLTFCPSPSTSRMLEEHNFSNVRLWPRGVDVELFRPEARDFALRQSWGVEPQALDEHHPSPRINPFSTGRTFDDIPLLSLPPAYAAHGYSSTSTATPLPGSKLVVLYVGRISWEKNLRLLIESFRSLETADPTTGRPACQLVFVGDGPARTEAEALCKDYHLDAKFLGFKKGEELAACFASADIFAFPSWTETFGQVVSEAQSCGLPVVGLRAEGVCDLVEHERTGLLLDMDDLLPNGPKMPTNPAAFKPLPTDPHSLVGSSSPTFPVAVELYRFLLVRSATLHDERRQMGSAAHLVASKRSWFGAMEMLVDGYREVIGKAERRSFSETPTIKFDVVTQDATTEKAEQVGPQTRRRKKLSKLRRSSRSFVTFSDDKVTQAMCVRFVEIAVLLLFVCLSLRYTSTWKAINQLRDLSSSTPIAL